jgi:hypothetical protein
LCLRTQGGKTREQNQFPMLHEIPRTAVVNALHAVDQPRSAAMPMRESLFMRDGKAIHNWTLVSPWARTNPYNKFMCENARISTVD